MTRWLALVALLLAACAGEAPSLDATEETAPLNVVEAVEAEQAPVCAVTFTPDAELAAETQDAAARWSAATGCDIRVGEGGIAVHLVAERMLTPWGTEAHGATYCPKDACTRSEVAIDVAADHVPATVAHEMGHALASTTLHADGEDALMFRTGGEGAILAADLEYVCASLGCTRFAPEA